MDSLNNAGGIYDGSSQAGLRAGGFSIEPAKKKRGRPRKYTPEGNIALGLGPTSVHSSSGGDHHHHHHHGGGTSGGGGDGNLTGSSEQQAKKHRGRPPGLGKKQMDALGDLFFFSHEDEAFLLFAVSGGLCESLGLSISFMFWGL